MNLLKKLTLSVWLISFLSVNFNTQAQFFSFFDTEKMSYGPKVGISLNSFNQNFEKITKCKFGLAGGGFFQFQVLDYLAASVEVLYIQQGAVDVEPTLIYFPTGFILYDYVNDEPKNVKTNITLHNIDIPVLVNYTLNSNGVRIFIGGAISTNLKATATNRVFREMINGPTEVTVSKDDVTSRFKYNDYALIVGGGLNFEAGGYDCTLDIRYRAGLTNINNVYSLIAPSSFNNSSFVLMLGVVIG